MKPVIALVGRPNVGKSTLFNALTRSRDALVADYPGLTRDRKYGESRAGDRPYLVIDTGGLSGEQGIDAVMAQQVDAAISEADTILFMVDAREGLTATDETIAHLLRQTGKPITVAANKVDCVDPDIACAEFHALGLGEPFPVVATHRHGVRTLMERMLEPWPEDEKAEEGHDGSIRVAVIGRPNVGKSTLINRILGEERVLVYDMPGTTRDSIHIPFERDGQPYTMIDTAGVRRRARIVEPIEKFSVIKALQAITEAHIVIMVLDAHQEVSEQDASLLGHVLKAGRGVVIAVNKWDGLEVGQRERIRQEIDIKLPFLDFADIHFISALHGTNVGHLFSSVQQAYHSTMLNIGTPQLTELLEKVVNAHPPPLIRGRRIKLRYAHQGGRNPPLIVIHGNQTAVVPDNYRRYLEKAFRTHLDMHGTPIRLEFKSGENPYANKKNRLTPRQAAKRKRLFNYIKKSEKRYSRNRKSPG